MGEQIFEATDADGDIFDVETLADWSSAAVSVAVNGSSVYLKAAEVDGLITAITPYGAKTAPAATIEVGETYRLLPGAKTADGGGVYFGDDVTKVRVESGPDREGDYFVRALDGESGPRTQYVGSKYLAPLTDEPTEAEPIPAGLAAVGKVFRLAPDAEDGLGSDLGDATRVRLLSIEPDDDGDYMVKPLDGDNAGAHLYVSGEYIVGLTDPETGDETDESTFLDVARVEAAEKASALMGDGPFGPSSEALIALADFLLGE